MSIAVDVTLSAAALGRLRSARPWYVRAGTVTELIAAVCSIAATRRRRFLWAVWTSGPPTADPFRKPDYFGGGARTREDAVRAAEAAVGGPVTVTDARWAGAFARLLRGEDAFRTKESRQRASGDVGAPPAKHERARSPFAILGIERDATPLAIRTAYRRAALEKHPDRGGSAPAFVELQRAYERALELSGKPARRRRR